MATRSPDRRILPSRKRRRVVSVERLWQRLAELFTTGDEYARATALVLAPRRLEPRRMLDAGAAGLALELLDSSEFVQAGPDYASLNSAEAPEASAAVVMNTPPSNLQVAPILPIDENGMASLSLSFDDPDAADPHTVEVNWGDGTPLQTFNLAAGTQTLATTHQYFDDPAGPGTEDFTVNVRVIDLAGADVATSRIATVHNVAPTASIVSSPVIFEGGTAVMVVTFSDLGSLDSHQVEVNWGDGSPLETTTVAAGTSFLLTSHAYLDDALPGAPDGFYTAKVRVFDDDGGAAPSKWQTSSSRIFRRRSRTSIRWRALMRTSSRR